MEILPKASFLHMGMSPHAFWCYVSRSLQTSLAVPLSSSSDSLIPASGGGQKHLPLLPAAHQPQSDCAGLAAVLLPSSSFILRVDSCRSWIHDPVTPLSLFF